MSCSCSAISCPKIPNITIPRNKDTMRTVNVNTYNTQERSTMALPGNGFLLNDILPPAPVAYHTFMPSTLERLLRPLVRRKQESQPVQNVLDTQGYGEQSIIDIFNNLNQGFGSHPSTILRSMYHALEPTIISLAAPIHCLHAEILGLICTYTLEPLCDRRRHAPGADYPPIILSSVCKW